jgi:uroporphyrinogen decarboxylase
LEERLLGSKERAWKAVLLEEPDIVPLYEICITPHVASKILGRTPVYWNWKAILELRARGVSSERIEEKINKDLIDLFFKKLHHDIIHVWYGLSNYPTSGTVKFVGENLWQVGDAQFRFLPVTSELERYPPIISEPEDVEENILQKWNSASEEVEKNLPTVQKMVKEIGEKVFIVTWIGGLGLHRWELEHLLPWLYKYPEIVEKYVQFHAHNCIETAKVMLDSGIDACFIDCDWAYKHGPFMSPRHFKSIWYPALKAVIDFVHKKGSLIIAHADGNINLILEDIVDAGIDGYQGVEPTAGMNIGEVKEKFGDRISLWGNIDLGFPLSLGTPDDTIRAVKNCIKLASSGGGHIMCSCNAIHEGVKPKNYLAMCKSVMKYGKYNRLR